MAAPRTFLRAWDDGKGSSLTVTVNGAGGVDIIGVSHRGSDTTEVTTVELPDEKIRDLIEVLHTARMLNKMSTREGD